MNGMEMELKLKKNSKIARKRIKLLVRLTVFLMIVALTALSCHYSYNYVIEKSKGSNMAPLPEVDPDKGVYIDIPRGAGTETIAKILEEKGIIKYPYLFKLLSMVNGYDGKYQSGTHLVSADLEYEEIMRILSSKPISVKVTIPEGYNVKQIANALYKSKLISSVEKFYEAVNKEEFNYKFLKDIPKREFRLEGYLFPDTYEFDIHAGEKEIINKLLSNFNNKFKPEFYERAKARDMTPDQIIILASIIEREAKNPEEREIIAGIFYNRLKNKDSSLRKLQSCATIQYIYYMRDGIIKETITEEDTKVDSPYNTYQIEGLPPGPICNPGEDAILAALYPEKTDYLYFVAKGDGTHHFSKTYKEHQAAMKKYGVN